MVVAMRHCFAVTMAFCLLANAFSSPALLRRSNRATGDPEISNDIDDIAVSDASTTQDSSIATVTPDPFDGDDDDDDDFEFGGSDTSSNGGGSNIFSILRVVSALFPGSSAAAVKNLIRRYLAGMHTVVKTHRQYELGNGIEIDYIANTRPLFQKQEDKESELVSSESGADDSEENAAEEESMETNDVRDASKQDSNSNTVSEEDSDYDEPPGGGDGAGGGILGLLAGLSGGEDGQSDLGSLLATFSGIIANLSGDGIDLNSLIASGIGLFVGLLSEGEENPGAVIASYLLTSLDTITGGGAKNNGAFFGTFLSKLVKGTSAGGDPEASSEEDGKNPPMADSAGFVSSFLLALLGDMSKSSSGGSSKPWR